MPNRKGPKHKRTSKKSTKKKGKGSSGFSSRGSKNQKKALRYKAKYGSYKNYYQRTTKKAAVREANGTPYLLILVCVTFLLLAAYTSFTH